MERIQVAIVGGGPVGALLYSYLGRLRLDVRLFEKRADPRRHPNGSGRSINVGISPRGIHALDGLGITREVLGEAIPMRGRVIHALDKTGRPAVFTRHYRVSEPALNRALSRNGFNGALLNAAEKILNGGIAFHHELVDCSPADGQLRFHDADCGRERLVQAEVVLSADGAHSLMRQRLVSHAPELYRFSIADSGVGYKEVTFPAQNGGWAMEKEALHLWPRGKTMLLAMPNTNGSFTGTLFMPRVGEAGLDALNTESAVGQFFHRQFPDTMNHLGPFTGAFLSRPTGRLSTVSGFPWIFPKCRGVLIGDAAHAILPFYAQGMNCGFEDVSTLADLIGNTRGRSIPWPDILQRFQTLRKPQADAIARMALANYAELADEVGQEKFLVHRILEGILARLFPQTYIPRYRLVAFTRTPYALADEVGHIQDRILRDLTAGIRTPGQLMARLVFILPKAALLVHRHLGPYRERYA
jgi:kynurenine 3-monooxygenase